MATSTGTFTTRNEAAEREQKMNGERIPSPSRKDDAFRKRACIERFLRVEDNLNGLFENILDKKTQLHENVDALQRILKEYMDSSDNEEVDALRNEVELQTAKLQQAEMENSDLNGKVEKLADEFGKSESKLKKAETENSELERKVEKLADEFGKSESKLKKAETENSDLERKVEKLADDFRKSESKLKKAETENSDLERKVEKLADDFGKSKSKLKKAETENSDLERKVEKLADDFGKSKSKLKKAETENSDLERKVEKLADDFGKSESKLKKAETENSELERKVEKLTDDFGKSESKLKKAETENSDLERKVEKLADDFGKSESKLKQAETENSDLKKELNTFKNSEAVFTKILQQHKEENDLRKMEFEKSNVQVSELEQKLKESETKNGEMLLKLKESNERFDSWEKVGAEKNAQTGTTQRNGKNAKEADENEDEDCTNVHQEIIDLMDNWFQASYSDIYTTVIQSGSIEKSTVEDILFYTLWKIYTDSRSAVLMQLNKLRKGLYYPYTYESAVPDPTIPKNINNGLKRLMAKVEVKDERSLFKEDLLRIINTKYPKFPTYAPKFASYMNACVYLCRQLILKSECFNLKIHKIAASLDRTEFNLTTGKEEDNVKRVIVPALVCLKNNVFSTLRKGSVSSLT